MEIEFKKKREKIYTINWKEKDKFLFFSKKRNGITLWLGKPTSYRFRIFFLCVSIDKFIGNSFL